jgi:cell wall-associated NlpC family hydrolase
VKETGSDKPRIAKSKEKDKDEEKPFYSYEPMSRFQSLIVREAERWIGTPYCWGGESLKCTDCSGFVQQVYQKAGIELPRTAAEQFIACADVDKSQRQAGDLIFFSNGVYISHVGIYVGNNYFIHASSSLGVIRQWVDDDYFRTRFVGYKRVLRA